MLYAEVGKEMYGAIFFFALKPCITVRVGEAMPARGIAITWQQLFCLQKRRTVML